MNETRKDINDSSSADSQEDIHLGGFVERFLDSLTQPQSLYSLGAAAAIPFLKKGRKFASKNPTITVLLLGGILLGYFLTREDSAHTVDRTLH